MKKVNFSKVFIAVFMAMLTLMPSCGGNSNQANKKPEPISIKTIPIKIKYLENGNVIPNAVIYLLYYDLDKSELVEKTANTGNGETVSFNVPLDKEGASFPFVYVFTKEDADKVKELVKTTTVRSYRTPSDSNCAYLGLTVIKNSGMTTEGCSIQIWSMGKK